MMFTAARTTSNGQAACQHFRCGYSLGRTPATTILVVIKRMFGAAPGSEWRGEVVMLCNRHAGTVRSTLTRNSRINSQQYRFYPENPNSVVTDNVSRRAVLDYLADIALVEQRRAEYLEGNRQREREAYLAQSTHTPGYPSLTPANEYGNVYVTVSSTRMTPNNARALAAQLLALATEAETASLVRLSL